MSKAQEYFGGLPTDPEVRKLRERFPDMESLKGMTITHEEIEVTINLRRDHDRYHTVTTAWRKRVAKDTGIIIRGDWPETIGIGFRVLSDSEMLRFSVDRRKRGGRMIRSSHIALANIDDSKLTDEERRLRQHGLHAVKMIHTAIIEARRFIPEPPKPPGKS
jgi:hypothetical protein